MTTQRLLDNQLQKHKLLGQEICQQMWQAIITLGYQESDVEGIPDFEQAEFKLVKDPYTADQNLAGLWYDKHKQRIGTIQFNSDGSFYAEYDIIRLHPSKKNWFVEAMSAWGSQGQIKTEAKLLPTQ